jgi:hypothetical protein
MTEAASSPGGDASEPPPGQPGGGTAPARRGTAHDHKQLAAGLGWSPVQVAKAAALGVLPPYDLRTPRWKASTVEVLAGRREELAAALDEGALLTGQEMRARLGLDPGDWHRSRDHGIIPGPDQAGFWTRAAADALAAGGGLRDAIPLQPLGANRCAAILAALTGLDVTQDDFLDLANAGHVDCVDWYKEKPREHLRAQRFPDSYVVKGNQGEQTMQAGNAVSANVANWLGRAVAAVL